MALVSLGPSDAGVGRTALVKSLGGEVIRVDLDQPQRIRIEGPLGTTTVAIEHGAASIVESPCPHHLCIRKGRISRTGDWVACIPNGVIVSIEGESDYDGITP